MDSAHRFDADSNPTFQFMGACMDIFASHCGQRYRYPTEKEHIENN